MNLTNLPDDYSSPIFRHKSYLKLFKDKLRNRYPYPSTDEADALRERRRPQHLLNYELVLNADRKAYRHTIPASGESWETWNFNVTLLAQPYKTWDQVNEMMLVGGHPKGAKIEMRHVVDVVSLGLHWKMWEHERHMLAAADHMLEQRKKAYENWVDYATQESMKGRPLEVWEIMQNTDAVLKQQHERERRLERTHWFFHIVCLTIDNKILEHEGHNSQIPIPSIPEKLK